MSLPHGFAQALMALSFAAPCFSMGFQLLAVWRDPMAMDRGRWVQLGIGIFVLEFILLHAGVLIGAQSVGAGDEVSPLGMLLLIGFYALFAAAIALAFKSRMLFNAFLWVVLGRFVGVLFGVSNDDRQLFLAHSVVAIVIYFGMVMASVFVPWPKLGITDEVAAATRVPGASGLWVDQPHRAIGAATVYFLLLGAVEVLVMTWLDPRAFVVH